MSDGVGGGPDRLPALPGRDAGGHKGTFGTVVVIGGCAAGGAAMLGAPVLAARGALRAGAGLVRLLVPEPLLIPALTLLPSATGVGLAVDAGGRVVPHLAAEAIDAALVRADAVVVGPGLGSAAVGGLGVESIALRCVGQAERPVVVDADALNALAGLRDYPGDLRAPAVFTPHPGEFDRLAGPIGLREVAAAGALSAQRRAEGASAMARRLGVVMVLKGAGTVVSDGLRTWACGRGHACLATGGSGDVLAGVLGGLIAQFVTIGPRSIGPYELPLPPGRPLDLYDAARLAVEAHAIGGELWARRFGAEAGMLASELADEMPGALAGLRAQSVGAGGE